MKIVGLIASLSLTFFSIGQKSYYFSSSLPSGEASLVTVDKKWHGKYALGAGNLLLEVSETGIAMISTTISSISREEIRESSTYDVRNGYIFGVVLNDSIPCVLEDDRYFFGIRNKDQIVGGSSKNVLSASGRVANEYILNTYENGYYIPSILLFENKSVTSKQLDYDLETSVFDFVASQKNVQGAALDLVVLSPTNEEFKSLLNTVFLIVDVYKKTK